MLGLAYQGQGQLNLAWDKFRQVPVSEALLENLYSLGLDFERKRQFNKAEAVFRHMHAFNPTFRDLEAKIARAKQLSETVILGGAASHPGGTLALGEVEKPKFGRFEVQKELGKGAMGVVYLGKDPKIGRDVAIKTLALAQEFEADELTQAKERFFREAETAGRLSHPNIVTIYDTGEEHDFCYIAMELLKGGDLAPYTKAGNLLPVDQVVSITARVADALGYAHRQGVVHRDIKPANMMYHRELEDQDRHGARHAVLHVARAARREADRGALGPVLARRDPVPAALRQAAVRGRVDGAAHVQDCQRAADRHPRRQPGARAVAGGVRRARAGENPRRALPDRRGARLRAPRGAGRDVAQQRRQPQQAAAADHLHA